MVQYRNERNGVVADLPEGHDVDLGAHWSKVGEPAETAATKREAQASKTE